MSCRPALPGCPAARLVSVLPPGPFTTAEALRAGIGRGVLDGPDGATAAPGRARRCGGRPLPDAGGRRPARRPGGRPADRDQRAQAGRCCRRAGAAAALRHRAPAPGPTPGSAGHPGADAAARPRRVVSPVSALLAAATSTDLVELVVAGDHLVRTGRCSPEELRAGAAVWCGRGARAARRAALPGARARRLTARDGAPALPPARRPARAGAERRAGRGRTGPSAGSTWSTGSCGWRWSTRGTSTGPTRSSGTATSSATSRRRQGWRLVRVTAARAARPRSVVVATLQAFRAAGYLGPDPVLTPEWVQLFSASARELRRRRAFDPSFRALVRTSRG